jgi:predicted aspartyl protease
MITGVVQADIARIRVKVVGWRGLEHDVEAVIDSGYSGALTLPAALINLLGLRWRSLEHGTLADGSRCVFPAYTGKLFWDGKLRSILVDEAEGDPLVGMRLLRGYELRIQVRARGKVTIKQLPSR